MCVKLQSPLFLRLSECTYRALNEPNNPRLFYRTTVRQDDRENAERYLQTASGRYQTLLTMAGVVTLAFMYVQHFRVAEVGLTMFVGALTILRDRGKNGCIYSQCSFFLQPNPH